MEGVINKITQLGPYLLQTDHGLVRAYAITLDVVPVHAGSECNKRKANSDDQDKSRIAETLSPE